MLFMKHIKRRGFTAKATATLLSFFALILQLDINSKNVRAQAYSQGEAGSDYINSTRGEVRVYTDPQTGDRVTDVIAPRQNNQQQNAPLYIYPQVTPDQWTGPNPQPGPGPRPYPPRPDPKPWPPKPGPDPRPDPKPWPPKPNPPYQPPNPAPGSGSQPKLWPQPTPSHPQPLSPPWQPAPFGRFGR